MKDKLLLFVLLLIALFPWEIWSISDDPYVEEGVIEQVVKNPRNILVIVWFLIYGWYLFLSTLIDKRNLPIWLISACVVAGSNGLNEIMRFIAWMAFVRGGTILISNMRIASNFLRSHFFLSLLSLPSLSLPFAGFNENPNRYARDLIYDYKFGGISLLVVLVLVLLTGSRGALLFLGAFIFVLFVRNRVILMGVILISIFLPLIFISDSGLTTGRNLAWLSGISGFLQNPIYGNGWIDVLEYLWESGVPSTNFHNIWIEILFRFGLVGLISFLWLMSRTRLTWIFPFLILGNVESFLFGYSMDALMFWGIIFYEKSDIH